MICRMTGITCVYANDKGYCASTDGCNINVVGNIISKERSKNISDSLRKKMADKTAKNILIALDVIIFQLGAIIVILFTLATR